MNLVPSLFLVDMIIEGEEYASAAKRVEWYTWLNIISKTQRIRPQAASDGKNRFSVGVFDAPI